MLLKGNCLELLKTLEDNSIDSIVTDPPYELSFMGKSWDASGIAYNVELWQQALRVLKPGGHLLAFSGSRTYHRMAVAIEDAGFEIRDQIMWIYGSGFPKSLDVSKAIDKAAGAERNRVPFDGGIASGHDNYGGGNSVRVNDGTKQEDTPATPEAQRWQGWGTALKPAHEPIVVARKPLTGTVASNVLEWGTGALNIDGSRVGTDGGTKGADAGPSNGIYGEGLNGAFGKPVEGLGRWPANVIHDGSEEVLAGFPTSKSAPFKSATTTGERNIYGSAEFDYTGRGYSDEGSAARFFYCAKASKSERNAGLEKLPEKRESDREKDDGVGGDNPRNRTNTARQNFHPTVKPIALMRYLVKLVTPPNGLVLDPFLGSGTTAVACVLEGFYWVGCEMTEEYFPIIEARVAWAEKQPRTLI
jgi:DNA modification methylase